MNKEKTLKDQIIEHIAKFSLGRTIRGAGQLINQYFAAFLLGPAIFGTWEAVRLILSYGGYTGLGSMEGMHLKVPLLRGAEKKEDISEIKNVSFIFNFGATTILSFLIFFSTFFINLSPEITLAFRFIALILFIQFFKTFYETWLKANNKFDIISKIAVIDGIGFGLSVILIFFFSFIGFLIGYTLSIIAGTIYAFLKSDCLINLQWKTSVFKKLIVVGFPIMLIGVSSVLFQTVDRLLILKFLDIKLLGFYSIGSLAFLPIMFILYSANSVMFPRFAERFGKTGKEIDLKKFITLPIRNLSLLIPVLIGGVVVILPTLVRFFLPEYIEGITAAQILLFGLFFASTVGMAGNFFLVTNRQYFYLGILLVGVLINLILSSILIRFGLGIVGVAIGTSISYLVFFLAMIIISMNHCKVKIKETLGFLLKVLLPMAYILVISFLIIKFVNIKELTTLDLIKNVILKESIFLIFSSYLVYLFLKKLEIKNYSSILWKK